MLESILPALTGMITTARAMASFDAFRKGRKGDVRALIEELKENFRLCCHVVNDGIDHKTVISKFATAEFDRLNKAGFNFNALQSKKISAFPGIEKTDLASHGMRTYAHRARRASGQTSLGWPTTRPPSRWLRRTRHDLH